MKMGDTITYLLAGGALVLWIVQRFHQFRRADAREFGRSQREDDDWERTRAALDRQRAAAETRRDPTDPRSSIDLRQRGR